MYPVLVSLGPVQFYSFGTLLIVGITLSWILLRYLVFFYHLQPRTFYYSLPWAVVGGLLVARLGFVFTYTERWRAGIANTLFPPWWWAEWAVWGGIIGIALGFTVYWLKHNEPVFLWLDIISIALQPLVFFASLGLFLSPVGLTADALGRPTVLPWGITVDAVDLPFANVPVHPLLLYVVITALAAFIIVWLTKSWARTYIGRLFVLVTALYSGLWFWLGAVRWYSPHPFLGIDVYILSLF
jgi:prolipoprotein diacylglyceryltransferase